MRDTFSGRDRPLKVVLVDATGPGGKRVSAATGAGGRYTIPVGPGAWTVAARAGVTTSREAYDPGSQAVSVADKAVTADFTLRPADEIRVTTGLDSGALERAWELRAAIRGWDAMYVALAEVLDVPLVTLDGRLARATGPRCRIELVS